MLGKIFFDNKHPSQLSTPVDQKHSKERSFPEIRSEFSLPFEVYSFYAAHSELLSILLISFNLRK